MIIQNVIRRLLLNITGFKVHQLFKYRSVRCTVKRKELNSSEDRHTKEQHRARFQHERRR
jgi:hypothetical protein